MDSIEGLPKVEGCSTILVVVDRLSKYAHFVCLKHPYSTEMVVAIFVMEIVRLHGLPISIISDRDKIFMSHFLLEIFRLQGIVLKRSTAYHPQKDGQSEVVNRCIEAYLRCFSLGKPRQWPKWVSWAEYWYNAASHFAIGCTPFKALYGRDPPFLL